MVFISRKVPLGPLDPKNVKVPNIRVLKKRKKNFRFFWSKNHSLLQPKTRVVLLIVDFAYMNCEICTTFFSVGVNLTISFDEENHCLFQSWKPEELVKVCTDFVEMLTYIMNIFTHIGQSEWQLVRSLLRLFLSMWPCFSGHNGYGLTLL